VSNALLHRAAHHLRHTVAPWLRNQLVLLQRDTKRQRIASVACATVAASTFGLALVNVHRTNTALGTRVVTYVAARELRPGDTITDHGITRVEQPSAFLPPTALADSPIGRTARQHVMPGEVLTSTNVHADGQHHVPNGWRVVAITARSTMPPLHAGARVDVIARAVVLVTDAIVVSVGDANRSAMIAVPSAFAAVVATEAALGEATLAASG